MQRREKGFTLIELVVVIAILAILAGVAVPQFVNLTKEAKISAEKADVGAVRSAIMSKGVEKMLADKKSLPQFPTTLEDASVADSHFAAVLDQTSAVDMKKRGWSLSSSTYTGPGKGTYDYTAATGQFKTLTEPTGE